MYLDASFVFWKELSLNGYTKVFNLSNIDVLIYSFIEWSFIFRPWPTKAAKTELKRVGFYNETSSAGVIFRQPTSHWLQWKENAERLWIRRRSKHAGNLYKTLELWIKPFLFTLSLPYIICCILYYVNGPLWLGLRGA